jgi:ADP-heptose:LPS heptosyltransferase
MPESKFLIVRLGSLGDIVHAFPAVAALKETFPQNKIVWLTHPRWRELVASAGIANEIWEVDTRSFAAVRGIRQKIRAEGFTASIDYQGLWKSAALPFLSGVPRRIGFSSESVREFGVPLLYTDRVLAQSVHVVDMNGELSARAGTVKPTASFSLVVSEEAKATVRGMLTSNAIEEYVVLSPGGGWLSKSWPAERYGALAARLQGESRVRCVINYGPGEKALAERVFVASGDAAPVLYSGTFSELMVLLRGARCVVAGDTGPMHLADALGTKVVAIFGPTDPERNGPYLGRFAGTATVLRAEDVESTYKRAEDAHPSLLQISVDQVFEAMHNLEAR